MFRYIGKINGKREFLTGIEAKLYIKYGEKAVIERRKLNETKIEDGIEEPSNEIDEEELVIVDDDPNKVKYWLHGLYKCPYCGEEIPTSYQRYGIARYRNNTTNPYVRDYAVKKILKPACSFNCARKTIDRLNKERSKEEIKNKIYYDRYSK